MTKIFRNKEKNFTVKVPTQKGGKIVVRRDGLVPIYAPYGSYKGCDAIALHVLEEEFEEA